jgi:hypothetical protein
MKGTLTRSYKFSTIIRIEDLIQLDNFILSQYPFVKRYITTANGGEYFVESINEIIDYDNPDYRKITKISIRAKKEEDKYSTYPDFEIYISDLKHFFTSVSFTIRQENEKEITFISTKIDDLIQNYKAKYSWVNKNSFSICFYLLIWLFVYGLFHFFFYKKIDNISYFVSIFSLSLIVGLLTPQVFIPLLRKIYPETIFYIGKQQLLFDKINKFKDTIFYLIVITFLVGVGSSLFVYFITK